MSYGATVFEELTEAQGCTSKTSHTVLSRRYQFLPIRVSRELPTTWLPLEQIVQERERAQAEERVPKIEAATFHNLDS